MLPKLLAPVSGNIGKTPVLLPSEGASDLSVSPNTMENKTRTADRVSGLDSLRFICALWVFFGHGAAPPLVDTLARDSRVSLIVQGLYNNLWNGPAAVIVFFVISGFCIHYPFAEKLKRPHLLEFYSRRFLRLLIPVAVAVPLSQILGVKLTLFQDSVLWSLLAELIYYIIYPALRATRLGCRSWMPLIIGSYLVSYALVLTNPTAVDYTAFGWGLCWLLGLPSWLLGCALAEAVRCGSGPTPLPGSIWLWRAAVLSSAWVCSSLRFHSPIGNPWTLNLFGPLVFAWLLREIAFRKTHPPAAWLEWAGLWSYSIYLMHPVAWSLFDQIFPPVHNEWLRWACLCCFVLSVCYGFYLLVERPGHAIARWASRQLRGTLPLEKAPESSKEVI
jgi:peptidoglycan/LPS O-acetylase OafA/YrhL